MVSQDSFLGTGMGTYLRAASGKSIESNELPSIVPHKSPGGKPLGKWTVVGTSAQPANYNSPSKCTGRVASALYESRHHYDDHSNAFGQVRDFDANNQVQVPFWDFIQSFDPQGHGAGVGVDHTGAPQYGAGFSFHPESFSWGPWGAWGGRSWGGQSRSRGHGRHVRQHRRDGNETGEESHEDQEHSEMEESPDTMRDAPKDPDGSHPPPPPPPPPGPPHPSRPPFGPPHHGPHRHRHQGAHAFGPGPHRRRSGRWGGPPGGPRERHGGPPPFEWNCPWDFRPMLNLMNFHPLAQNLHVYVEQARSGNQQVAGEDNETQDDTFTPPVDVFSTEKAFVLHISLPGAKKEDVGVDWDPERSKLNIAGVVYPPGNEEYFQTLTSSERQIGMFQRSITLPPAGSDEKQDIDTFSICQNGKRHSDRNCPQGRKGVDRDPQHRC